MFLKNDKLEKCIYSKQSPIGIFLRQQLFSCLTIFLNSLKAINIFCVFKYVVKHFKSMDFEIRTDPCEEP